jgi:lactate dehydrogenase-like 2-hydroxyacid dehydrogenase
VGKLPPSLAEALAAKYLPLQLPDDLSRSSFLANHGPSIAAIVASGPPGVDADLLQALPNLGAIVNLGDSYDTVDVETARRLGIGVSNTPDVFTDAVADTAVGLMLATIRRFCAADRYVRADRWPQDGNYPVTREASGKQVGILGLGRIGSAIAARLIAFKCAIAYHNRHQLPDCPYRYAASAAELAARVDVLIVATPGGAATEKLVSRTVLEALGPDGYLINIARGNVVDEEALVELLVDGQLAGAGLDVFADEPFVPQRLYSLDNVVLLPHMGGATNEAISAATALVLRNLEGYFNQGTLTTPVVQPARPRSG